MNRRHAAIIHGFGSKPPRRAAGLATNPSALPSWWGLVDVTLAFLLAIASFALQALNRRNLGPSIDNRVLRIYRASIHALIAVAIIVMVAGDRVHWANCATGFLWRAWLGLYLLPWWLAAMTLSDRRR